MQFFSGKWAYITKQHNDEDDDDDEPVLLLITCEKINLTKK